MGTHNSVVILAFVLAFGAWFPNQAWAEDAEDPRSQTLSLPYAFYNDSFGAAGGYVFGLSGYPEPQSSLLAAAMAGTEGAGMVFITGQDLRPGWEGGDLDRVFFDPIVSVGYFNEVEVFVDGDPRFNDRRAGAANSDEDDSITGEGWDYFFRLRMKYLMPFGHAEEDIIARYVIKDGLLESGATGGRSLNPLLSGRTFLELQPFYRSQDIKSDEITSDLKSNGIDISLFWDNRDFPRNPERGQGLQFKLTRDFGLFDSSESWTAVQFEYDQYFSLGADDTFRQRVLAFDFWTADSVTWKVSPSGEIMNRPPAYAGATLGGLWKLRGYPAHRFNDKAAIYYGAELRLIPKWNPFDAWPAIQESLGVEWLQFVPFIEAGSVAPSWNIGDLHSDLKWNVGLGVRAWAKGFVVRADFAVSEEEAGVQMMIAQPF